MKYEKPTIITYTEEDVLAIVGPAQMGDTSGLDGFMLDEIDELG